MKALALILILILFASFSAGAEAPEAVLSRIDALIGYPTLEDSFHTGDQLEVQFTESLRGIDSRSTSIVTVTRDGDNVDLIGRRTDGSAGSKENLNRAFWTKWKGNFLRSQIEFIEGYGYKMDLTVVGEEVFTVTVNQKPIQVRALRVNCTGSHSLGSKMTGSFLVTPDLPGAAQILYREESVTGIVRTWTLSKFSTKREFPKQN